MRCAWCGGGMEFVDGGDWAGLRCARRLCPGRSRMQPEHEPPISETEGGR